MQQFLLLLYYSASGTIKLGINVSDPNCFIYVDPNPDSEKKMWCREDPDPKYLNSCFFHVLNHIVKKEIIWRKIILKSEIFYAYPNPNLNNLKKEV